MKTAVAGMSVPTTAALLLVNPPSRSNGCPLNRIAHK